MTLLSLHGLSSLDYITFQETIALIYRTFIVHLLNKKEIASVENEIKQA